MKAEYRIKELNGKFTIETKVETIRFEGFWPQIKVQNIEWRLVTIHGHPLFTINVRGLPPINNYNQKLKPFDTLEEAVAKIKEFREPPVYYNENGRPEEDDYDFPDIPGSKPTKL
jgi:hypothetical protein